VRADDRPLMEYIDSEVTAVCETMGWGHQIRRKWSVREKPVGESTIGDYEWKLIPDAQGKLSVAPRGDFDGIYYVLRFNEESRRFVLQHDTSRCGIMGPRWEVETYSEIRPHSLNTDVSPEEDAGSGVAPPSGWLRDHLHELLRRFGPNNFSVT